MFDFVCTTLETNRLLLGRPLLVGGYGTTMKSARTLKVKSIFGIWTANARIVIFLKITPMHFRREIVHNYLNLTKIVRGAFKKILLLWSYDPSVGPFFGALNSSYSLDTYIWEIHSWILSMNKIRPTVRAGAYKVHSHTYIHLHIQTERQTSQFVINKKAQNV
jgi:hypothetical protein